MAAGKRGDRWWMVMTLVLILAVGIIPPGCNQQQQCHTDTECEHND